MEKRYLEVARTVPWLKDSVKMYDGIRTYLEAHFRRIAGHGGWDDSARVAAGSLVRLGSTIRDEVIRLGLYDTSQELVHE